MSSESNQSGPEAAVKGIVEDAKGKVNEAAGSLTNNHSLKQEGQAQQNKAEAEREVAGREAQADKARAEAAAAAEADERAHQQ